MDRQPTPETNYTGPKSGEVFSIPDGEVLNPTVKSLEEVQARRGVEDSYPAPSPESLLTDEQKMVYVITHLSLVLARVRRAASNTDVSSVPENLDLAA